MAVLDPVADFVELTVNAPYVAADTQIDILATDSHFDLLPDPTTAGAYNLLWYDDTNYGTRPQDDPNREWVRVTNWNESAHRLVVTRAQEGTAATDKNTTGATYKMIMAIGKKFRNDIENSTVDVGAAYAWITEYGGVGDGVTDDYSAFVSAGVAGVRHLVIPQGTWRVSLAPVLSMSNVMTLEFHQNAILAPDTGITVDITANIIAGNYQIFGGLGTVTVDIGGSQRATIRHARWWATTADTVTVTSADSETLLSVARTGGGAANPCVAITETTSSGSALVVTTDAANEAVIINQSGEEQALQVNKTSTGAQTAVEVHNDGTGSGLEIQQDGNNPAGTSSALSIVQNGTGCPLFISGANGNHVIITVPKTPASAAAEGEVGTICWDSGALYVCVAADTWKKVAIATW